MDSLKDKCNSPCRQAIDCSDIYLQDNVFKHKNREWQKLKIKDNKLLFKKKRIKDTIYIFKHKSFSYAPMDDDRPCSFLVHSLDYATIWYF